VTARVIFFISRDILAGAESQLQQLSDEFAQVMLRMMYNVCNICIYS